MTNRVEEIKELIKLCHEHNITHLEVDGVVLKIAPVYEEPNIDNLPGKEAPMYGEDGRTREEQIAYFGAPVDTFEVP